METKGFVRLPNHSELQEVSSNLANLTSTQFKATRFQAVTLESTAFTGQKKICFPN
jgi:hypothetical protein